MKELYIEIYEDFCNWHGRKPTEEEMAIEWEEHYANLIDRYRDEAKYK